MQQKITPFLWFDDQAEEAAEFYTSLFDDSRVTNVTRYGPAGPGPEGSAMTVSFELAGQAFTALNGGPEFSFTEAISFYVSCDSQADLDRLTFDDPAIYAMIQRGVLTDKLHSVEAAGLARRYWITL